MLFLVFCIVFVLIVYLVSNLLYCMNELDELHERFVLFRRELNEARHERAQYAESVNEAFMVLGENLDTLNAKIGKTDENVAQLSFAVHGYGGIFKNNSLE